MSNRTRRAGRRSRGGFLKKAMLPGLLTLALLSKGRKKRHGTKKGMRRKTARRAYMKKHRGSRRR